MRRGLHVGAVALLVLLAAAVGATTRPAWLDPSRLAPGEFVWIPEAAPSGPLLMVVSLAEQRATLYRNGVRIAVTTVSSGKPGNETPPGVYTILQKREEHYSNLYDNAPMPFMQRLTWSGIALHAGRLPGHPASHGCIRLPEAFARKLFGVTGLGMTVVVADAVVHPPELVHPGWLAPAVPDEDAGAAPSVPVAVEEGATVWAPGRAPDGPMTLVLATDEGTLRVLRNGVEIGRTTVRFDGPERPAPRVLQLQAGSLPGENRHVPGRPRLDWRQIPLPGAEGGPPPDDARAAVHVPEGFARVVYEELRPGTTVVITDTVTARAGAAVLDTAPADTD